MIKKLLVFLALLSGSNALAEEYDVLFFSYQNKEGIAKPLHCHTFAVFTESDHGELKSKVVINWGPKDQWRVMDGKVPGHNHEETESIEKALSDRKVPKEVRMWGPFPITKDDYDRAADTRDDLDRNYLYNAVNIVGKSDPKRPAVNCIQAVIKATGKKHSTGSKMGHKATQEVVDFYRKEGVIQDAWNHSRIEGDLVKSLGLDKYPIKRN